MDLPFVSVIMPVHNAMPYLRDALDCLLTQTFTNFELVCVDDASSDSSLETLEQYRAQPAWRYPMRIVAHTVNGGAAKARNAGLAIAQGEYVIFLDSDDRFSARMLETAYQACRTSNADATLFGANYLYTNGMLVAHQNDAQLQQWIASYPVLNNPAIFPLLPFVMEPVPWNKLVRRALLEEKKIRFQDIPNANDVFFSYAVCVQAKRLVFVPDALVDYRREREGNLSQGRNATKNYLPYALDAVYDLACSLDLGADVLCALKNYIVRMLYVNYSLLTPHAQEIFLRELVEKFFPKWSFAKLPPEYFCAHNLYDFCQCVTRGQRPEPYFRTLIATQSDLLRIHLADFSQQGKRVALWGAGKYGAQCLRCLAQQGVRLNAVIDSAPQKRGQEFYGYTITDYDAVKDQIDVILITNSSWLPDIRRQTNGEKEIVDLMERLENTESLQ